MDGLTGYLTSDHLSFDVLWGERILEQSDTDYHQPPTRRQARRIGSDRNDRTVSFEMTDWWLNQPQFERLNNGPDRPVQHPSDR